MSGINAQPMLSDHSQPESSVSNTQGIVEKKCLQKLAAAKLRWKKLTNNEILHSQGNTEKLTSLIENRYSTNRSDAYKQVKSFFNSNQY